MTIFPARLRRMAPALLALAALLAAGCTSQHETAVSALHYFNRGNKAYLAEDFREAIVNYQRALGYDDRAPEFHYNLGLAYYRSGQYLAAVKSYRQAVTLAPDFADAYLNLALAYDKLYDLQSADDSYNHYRKLIGGQPVSNPSAAPPAYGASASARAAAPPGAGHGTARPPVTHRMTPGGANGSARSSGASLPAGTAPAQYDFQPRGGQPGGGAASHAQRPNPFQGTQKWWTQDRFIPKR